MILAGGTMKMTRQWLLGAALVVLNGSGCFFPDPKCDNDADCNALAGEKCDVVDKVCRVDAATSSSSSSGGGGSSLAGSSSGTGSSGSVTSGGGSSGTSSSSSGGTSSSFSGGCGSNDDCGPGMHCANHTCVSDSCPDSIAVTATLEPLPNPAYRSEQVSIPLNLTNNTGGTVSVSSVSATVAGVDLRWAAPITEVPADGLETSVDITLPQDSALVDVAISLELRQGECPYTVTSDAQPVELNAAPGISALLIHPTLARVVQMQHVPLSGRLVNLATGDTAFSVLSVGAVVGGQYQEGASGGSSSALAVLLKGESAPFVTPVLVPNGLSGDLGVVFRARVMALLPDGQGNSREVTLVRDSDAASWKVDALPMLEGQPAVSVVGGCVDVSFTLTQEANLPADVVVQYNAGGDDWRTATPGHDPLLAPADGVYRLDTKTGANHHVFRWNRWADMGSSGTQVRVVPRLRGAMPDPATLPPVQVEVVMVGGNRTCGVDYSAPLALPVLQDLKRWIPLVGKHGHMDLYGFLPGPSSGLILISAKGAGAGAFDTATPNALDGIGPVTGWNNVTFAGFATGQLDQDPRNEEDLAILVTGTSANVPASALLLYLNPVSSGFAAPKVQVVSFPACAAAVVQSSWVAALDVDPQDVHVLAGCGTDSWSFTVQGGNLGAPQALFNQDPPDLLGVLAGDLDGNGQADLMLALRRVGAMGAELQVAYNTTLPVTEQTALYALDDVSSAQLVDFNQDGITDLWVLGKQDAVIDWKGLLWLGVPGGHLGNPLAVSTPDGMDRPRGRLVDVEGNGFLELVLSNPAHPPVWPMLDVYPLKAEPDGSVVRQNSRVTVPVPQGLGEPVLVDMTGDWKTDVLAPAGSALFIYADLAGRTPMGLPVLTTTLDNVSALAGAHLAAAQDYLVCSDTQSPRSPVAFKWVESTLTPDNTLTLPVTASAPQFLDVNGDHVDEVFYRPDSSSELMMQDGDNVYSVPGPGWSSVYWYSVLRLTSQTGSSEPGLVTVEPADMGSVRVTVYGIGAVTPGTPGTVELVQKQTLNGVKGKDSDNTEHTLKWDSASILDLGASSVFLALTGPLNDVPDAALVRVLVLVNLDPNQGGDLQSESRALSINDRVQHVAAVRSNAGPVALVLAQAPRVFALSWPLSTSQETPLPMAAEIPPTAVLRTTDLNQDGSTDVLLLGAGGTVQTWLTAPQPPLLRTSVTLGMICESMDLVPAPAAPARPRLAVACTGANGPVHVVSPR